MERVDHERAPKRKLLNLRECGRNNIPAIISLLPGLIPSLALFLSFLSLVLQAVEKHLCIV